MQGEAKELPGHEKVKQVATKSKREKDKLVKKVSEAKSALEAISKKLAEEVNSLDSKASDYGRFQLTGGLKDFVVNERTLELILSEDRKGAIAKAKEEADKNVASAKAAKAKINTTKQQITGIEAVIKGKTGEDRVVLESKLEEVKRDLESFEASAKDLEAYEAHAQLLAQLSAKIDDKSARENWGKIEKDKELLKTKLKNIKALKIEEASAKIEHDTSHSIDSITTLLDELIGPFKDAVKNPYKFSILRIIDENLQGKDLATLTGFSKARIGFGIASDIVKDSNIELAGMSGSALKTVMTNLGEVVNLAADIPSLINNELKSKGQSPDDLNNLMQSNFISRILSSPAIFELLLNNSANLGQIIWNFQNDIASAIKIVVETPSDLTNQSKLKLVESLLSAPWQIETLVKIVGSNIPIFQTMFSDSKGAFNNFMREYGFANPELVAALIPSLVEIGSILPAHHESIQEILKEVGPLITSDQPIDLAAIFAPSAKDPTQTKFSVLLASASVLLFGSENKSGIVNGLHDMLASNSDTIAKLAVSNEIVQGFGVSEGLAKSAVELAAAIINPGNHMIIKEVLEILKTASIVNGAISMDTTKFTALGLKLAANPNLLTKLNKVLQSLSNDINNILDKFPAAVPILSSFGITRNIIGEVLKMGIGLTSGDSPRKITELIDLYAKIQFDKDGAPILGVADILAFTKAGAPLLKNAEFKSAFDALFDKENTDPLKPVINRLLSGFYGEKIPAGLANLVSDNNFALVGKITKSILDKAPEAVSAIGDNTTVSGLLGVLPKIFEKAVDKELLDDVNKLLTSNSDNISKALFAVPALKTFFDSYNITAKVIEPRIKLAASIISGENLPQLNALVAAASKIQLDKDGAPILGVTDILALASAGAPLLKNKEFRSLFEALFAKENTDPLKPVIVTLLGNIFEGEFPKGLAELVNDDNFSLLGNIAKHVVDKVPEVVSVVNTCDTQLAKIAILTSVQTQLTNPELRADERRALHKQAIFSQLDASDIRVLMSMSLNVLKTSGISPLITSSRTQLAELGNNEFLQSLVKPLLPEKLRDSNALLPQVISFGLSAAALITDEKVIAQLNEVPEKVEIILKLLGEEKPSIAQLYETASDIGEVLARVINDKDLVALYRNQFIPMIKGSRREIKSVIEDTLKASPNARKFHIDSEAVMRFLEDEKSLAKFGSAFNDLLQKDFSSRVRGTLKAAGIAITSGDARTIIWQLLIDVVISYFRENIVPGFVKRWMAGNSIAAVIDNVRITEESGKKPNLAEACKSYYTELGSTSLARYFIKTQNFSGQYITSELANMVIDSFDFKGASFAPPVIDLSNTEISNSNLSVALRYNQTLELTGAIIDIKTLESMVDLFNKGQISYALTTLKLSEPPISVEAQRVLGLINNSEIKAYLETNYVTKEQQPTKFAERATRKETIQGRHMT